MLGFLFENKIVTSISSKIRLLKPWNHFYIFQRVQEVTTSLTNLEITNCQSIQILFKDQSVIVQEENDETKTYCVIVSAQSRTTSRWTWTSGAARRSASGLPGRASSTSPGTSTRTSRARWAGTAAATTTRKRRRRRPCRTWSRLTQRRYATSRIIHDQKSDI